MLAQKQMNRLRKEQLKERLEKLDADEHAQIFEIVKRYTSDFTRTQVGVLVSSETLSDACIVEMERMVTYFYDQRKWMETSSRT
jgi:phosphopantetheine adenylyltransferase